MTSPHFGLDIGFCYVVQAGPKFTILLSQSPTCWDSRHAPPCPAYAISSYLCLVLLLEGVETPSQIAWRIIYKDLPRRQLEKLEMEGRHNILLLIKQIFELLDLPRLTRNNTERSLVTLYSFSQ